MKKTTWTALALVTGLLLLPQNAAAQSSQARDGFWFNAGLGYGSLGCQDCGSREGGFSGGLALGGTVSQKLLVGVASQAWTKSEQGATLTAGTLQGAVRFYPSATGGFHLLGGIGVGTVDVEIEGIGGASETGFSAALGVGYDIRMSDNVSLTPFWNGIGIAYDGGDANFGQIGAGVTVH